MKRYRAVMLGAIVAVGLLAGACGRSESSSSGGNDDPSAEAEAACRDVTLEATEIGVTADTITVQVMADTGSPLAPGLFQGNVDAMKNFATWINANGGIGCRQLVVEEWDSKLTAEESKNGIINACQTALAMVGGNSLFNPDVSVLSSCVDQAGTAAGLPVVAALANDINEQCHPNVWVIQAVAEPCTTTTGERELTAFVGQYKYYETVNPDLKGIFLVPGDLPTTRQSAAYQIIAQRDIGVDITDAFAVSGRAEQSAFTPFVQSLKSSGGNYVYNGSNDVTMAKMMKETAAQGYGADIDVWACSLACYTDAFKANGTSVDGAYVWMQFLPFEEADANATLKTYLDANRGQLVSWGAQAWQAGLLFKETIDKIVASDGPNAITRAKVIQTMMAITDFDAGGWMGAKGPKTTSDCFMVMQINNGTYERRYPEEVGELACEPDNIVKVKVDPAVAAEQLIK